MGRLRCIWQWQPVWARCICSCSLFGLPAVSLCDSYYTVHSTSVMMPEAPANNQGSSRVAAFLRGHSLGEFVDDLAAKGAASQKRSRPEKLITLAGTSSVGDGLKVKLLTSTGTPFTRQSCTHAAFSLG